MLPRLSAFLVHCFTASGAALGFAALIDAIEGRFPAMFAWLGAALVVDAVDGTLARRFNVEKLAPHIDGLLLDLVVDFLTYVVVPLVALWRSGLLAMPFATPICCGVSAASALYFADRRMKTGDLWFRGFPAIWNVLAFYLLVLRPEPLVASLIVIAAACLMFVPVVFVHPLRVVRLRKVTVTATGVWAVAAIAALSEDLSGASLITKAALVAVAIYFLALPLFRNIPFR